VAAFLLYDDGCRVCRFVARVVIRLDRGRELAVLPLDDVEAATFLEHLPEEERHASWRLARDDGVVVGFGAGLPELLREMRLTRPLGMLVGLVPDRSLDAAYRAVARRRGRFGRLVPDGPAPRVLR